MKNIQSLQKLQLGGKGGFAPFNPASIQGLQQRLLTKQIPVGSTVFDERTNKGTPRPVQLGRAYLGDGVNDYILTGLSMNTFAQTSFNIDVWLDPTDGQPAGVQAILGGMNNNSIFGVQGSGASNGILIQLETSGVLGFHYKAGGNFARADTNAAVFINGTQPNPRKFRFTAGGAGLTIGEFLNPLTSNVVTPIALNATNNGLFSTNNVVMSTFNYALNMTLFQRNALGVFTSTVPFAGEIFGFEVSNAAFVDYVFYKGDEGAGTAGTNAIAIDSSGNGRNGTIVNATLATFHSTQNIYSWQNEVGYTLGNGSNGAAVGVFIPRNEANTGFDVLGNALQFSGSAPNNGLLKNSNAVTFNGTTQHATTNASPAEDGELEAFFIPRAIAGDVVIAGSFGTQRCYLSYNTSGRITAGIGSQNFTNIIGTVQTMVIGTAYKAKVVWNGTTVQLFLAPINNAYVLEYSAAQSGNADNGINIALGALINSGGVTSNPANVTLLSVRLYSGSTITDQWDFAESSGTLLYNKVAGRASATLINAPTRALQNAYHSNMLNGFSMYTHETTADIMVPYSNAGLPLVITPPTGYTKAKDCPPPTAGNSYYNGAETQIDFTGGVASPSAVLGNWENAWTNFTTRINPRFKAVKSIDGSALGAFNFLAYANTLSGTALDKIDVIEGTFPFAGVTNGLARLYSLDPMLPTATGNVVRVRRAGDNAESNFTSAQIYSGAMTAYVIAGGGTQNGFVTTWYDQSTNASNATQATAGNQFQIVTAGVMNVEGTKLRAALLGIDAEANPSLMRYLNGTLPADLGLGDITLIAVAKKNINRTYQSVVHLNGFVSGSGGNSGGSFALQSTVVTTGLGVHNTWVAATNNTLDLDSRSTQHFVASTKRTGGTNGNGGINNIRAITTKGGLQTLQGTQTWTSGNGSNLFTIGTQGNVGTVWNWPEDIQCVAIYSRALTEPELTTIIARLEDVYGI